MKLNYIKLMYSVWIIRTNQSMLYAGVIVEMLRKRTYTAEGM
jgi:hypothetical protein